MRKIVNLSMSIILLSIMIVSIVAGETLALVDNKGTITKEIIYLPGDENLKIKEDSGAEIINSDKYPGEKCIDFGPETAPDTAIVNTVKDDGTYTDEYDVVYLDIKNLKGTYNIYSIMSNNHMSRTSVLTKIEVGDKIGSKTTKYAYKAVVDYYVAYVNVDGELKPATNSTIIGEDENENPIYEYTYEENGNPMKTGDKFHLKNTKLLYNVSYNNYTDIRLTIARKTGYMKLYGIILEPITSVSFDINENNRISYTFDYSELGIVPSFIIGANYNIMNDHLQEIEVNYHNSEDYQGKISTDSLNNINIEDDQGQYFKVFIFDENLNPLLTYE